MPELPEVETVRRGLAPVFDGAFIRKVTLNRAGLRFPFPADFDNRLQGTTVTGLGRRGKYLTASLSSGEWLIMHLGMTGRFTVREDASTSNNRPGSFQHEQSCNPVHDHVVIDLENAGRSFSVTYNDARRFGFLDLSDETDLADCSHFRAMGPEPLGNLFSPEILAASLKGKSAPIKAALLDQRIVAGLGNIYVCEALFRAGLSPRRKSCSIGPVRAARLHREIVTVLNEAIEAGGSTLRDFASADGELGYFQHCFDVYGREGEKCFRCEKDVKRIVQSGRSTFFCQGCQR